MSYNAQNPGKKPGWSKYPEHPSRWPREITVFVFIGLPFCDLDLVIAPACSESQNIRLKVEDWSAALWILGLGADRTLLLDRFNRLNDLGHFTKVELIILWFHNETVINMTMPSNQSVY